jgi:murein L,D-transpeptidase YafK
MPAKLVAAAVAMDADATTEFPDLLDELLSRQGGEILVHRQCASRVARWGKNSMQAAIKAARPVTAR